MAVDWTQAQAAVIGCALIDARCVPEILAEMRDEDFTGVFLRFFTALRELSAEQTPVDVVTVLAKTGSEYRDTAKDLLTMTPTAANVSAYIAACKEQSRLRLLRDVGLELSGAVTLEQARETLGRAAALSMETNRRKTVTAMEMAASWINSVNNQEKPEYVTCGVGCLDSAIHTVRGNYHIVAGFTGHGKSALALQLAWHIAQTRRVCYFSNELQSEEFLSRLVAMVSGAGVESVQSRNLSDEELTLTGRAAGAIFKAKLDFEPAAGYTVDDIRALVLQNGYEVIFVDYLQNVTPPARERGDRFRGVSDVSRGLQRLAHSLGVVVFAMSQLSRQLDDEDFRPVPPLSSLRESGQIEQDADAVIFVHAPMQRAYPRFRVLDIAKNRSGRLERYFIDYRVETQKFEPPGKEDFKIWSEVMRKRRALKADELAELRAEAEAQAYPSELVTAQKNRYKAKQSGGQTELPV